MSENEMRDTFGGDLFRDFGYLCHAWVDFWEGVGEGWYDALH